MVDEKGKIGCDKGTMIEPFLAEATQKRREGVRVFIGPDLGVFVTKICLLTLELIRGVSIT